MQVASKSNIAQCLHHSELPLAAVYQFVVVHIVIAIHSES